MLCAIIGHYNITNSTAKITNKNNINITNAITYGHLTNAIKYGKLFTINL